MRTIEHLPSFLTVFMISIKISVLPLPVTPCKRFGLYTPDLIAVFRLLMTISCSLLYNIFFFNDLNEVSSIALS